MLCGFHPLNRSARKSSPWFFGGFGLNIAHLSSGHICLHFRLRPQLTLNKLKWCFLLTHHKHVVILCILVKLFDSCIFYKYFIPLGSASPYSSREGVVVHPWRTSGYHRIMQRQIRQTVMVTHSQCPICLWFTKEAEAKRLMQSQEEHKCGVPDGPHGKFNLEPFSCGIKVPQLNEVIDHISRKGSNVCYWCSFLIKSLNWGGDEKSFCQCFGCSRSVNSNLAVRRRVVFGKARHAVVPR